jgi:curved DNA-binding protein CbpA
MTTSSLPVVTKETYANLNYYELLGVENPTAPIDEAAIGRIFRRLAIKFHSDRDGSAEARLVFDKLTTAMETLLDSAKRFEYDKSLKTSGVTAAPQRDDVQRAAQAAEEALRRREHEAKNAPTKADLARAQQEKIAALHSALLAELYAPFDLLEQEQLENWEMDFDDLAAKERQVMELFATSQPESSGGVLGGSDASEKESKKKKGKDEHKKEKKKKREKEGDQEGEGDEVPALSESELFAQSLGFFLTSKRPREEDP